MKKTWSIIRWLLVMCISLFGWITSKFMFPIAYWLRDVKLFRKYILWIYYDDEDEFGFGVDWWIGNKPFSLWTAYKWCALRNPAWNLQASLKPLFGLKKFVSCKGSHSKDGNSDISVYKMCVLKYVDKHGGYQNNKGDFLSLKHSVIGSMFVWYKIENRLYWRYSLAKNMVKNIWVELHLGTTDSRYTFRLKIKNVKVL